MLERVIKLKYVIKSYENAIDYVQQDERIRLKFMNVILNDNSNLFRETIKKGINEQKRDLLHKSIKKQGIQKPKSIEMLAKETGMLPYYNNVYRKLNSDVHSNSRSLLALSFFTSVVSNSGLLLLKNQRIGLNITFKSL